MKFKMFGNSLLMSYYTIFVTLLGNSLQIESIVDIVRDPSGDLFSIPSDDCLTNGCDRNGRFARTVRASVNQCRCQCSDSHPVIREDKSECVNRLGN